MLTAWILKIMDIVIICWFLTLLSFNISVLSTTMLGFLELEVTLWIKDWSHQKYKRCK